MNTKKIILLIILALVLSFLDMTFFSGLQIAGASIVSTYIFLINMSLIEDAKKFSNELFVFESSALLFFSIFSSVPVVLLFFFFFILPSLIVYLRKNYFSLPSPLVSFFFFIATALIFESTLLLYYKEWTHASINMLGYFILMNSCFGVVIYCLSYFLRSKEAKVRI